MDNLIYIRRNQHGHYEIFINNRHVETKSTIKEAAAFAEIMKGD